MLFFISWTHSWFIENNSKTCLQISNLDFFFFILCRRLRTFSICILWEKYRSFIWKLLYNLSKQSSFHFETLNNFETEGFHLSQSLFNLPNLSAVVKTDLNFQVVQMLIFIRLMEKREKWENLIYFCTLTFFRTWGKVSCVADVAIHGKIHWVIQASAALQRSIQCFVVWNFFGNSFYGWENRQMSEKIVL